jgi:hypothetical protein
VMVARPHSLAALVLVGVITACGGAPATSSPTPPATIETSTISSTATSAPAEVWEQITPGGECMCADGSPYNYWIHKGAPDKVVFFLDGGGACFDATTCELGGNTYYRFNLESDGDPNDYSSGIFDFGDARNPLADYSFVFAAYCTGDAHLGDTTHEYGPELTVQHKGSINASTALKALAAQFFNATEVVVVGESAGSIPTPMYAGLAHDLLPDASITVLADGSGAFPDVPAINAVLGAVWGTEAAIPPWKENAGLTAADWSFPDLFVQAHEHDPEIIFGRHDYAFDEELRFFNWTFGYASFNANQLTLIDANETQIEQGGVDLHSYVAPGNSHTVLTQPKFYTETVEGVRFVDWVSKLVRRQPAPDVHCTDCT